MKHAGGFAVFYYIGRSGHKFGSVNLYKVWMMSKRYGNANGKYYECGIAEFDGLLMSREYK